MPGLFLQFLLMPLFPILFPLSLLFGLVTLPFEIPGMIWHSVSNVLWQFYDFFIGPIIYGLGRMFGF